MARSMAVRDTTRYKLGTGKRFAKGVSIGSKKKSKSPGMMMGGMKGM